MNFTPKIDAAEAFKLAARFDRNNDRNALAAGEKIASGDYAVANFRTIFEWKTKGRGRSRIELNRNDEVADALHLATIEETPRASIAVLMGLHGVNVPVASAIMAMVQPEIHTGIDFRALETLSYQGGTRSLPCYLIYRSFCLNLASLWEMSLRNFDWALWLWSKVKSLTN